MHYQVNPYKMYMRRDSRQPLPSLSVGGRAAASDSITAAVTPPSCVRVKPSDYVHIQSRHKLERKRTAQARFA